MPTEPTLIEAVKAPAKDLTLGELNAVAAEALDPTSSPDSVTLGERAFTVKFLTWKAERQMLGIIAPYLRMLVDGASAGAFEEILGALLIEAQGDLTALALIILQAQDATIDEAWLDENARFEEIVTLVKAQVNKNKLADSLGKLWAPAALSLKVLRTLDTLPSRLTQLSQAR